jgi:predicted HD superfamily hydrolase involved in NAD metabolism
MQVMQDLAPIYGLDQEKAVLAGLLHDAGKDLSPPQQKAILAEAGVPSQTAWEQDYLNYMHGPAGAFLVRKELGIQDPQILDAIAMHTYCGDGENYDAPLSWCLRFSDLLEPNRRWDQKAHLIRDGASQLRELVYRGQMDNAAFYQTRLIIEFFRELGVPIHPNLYRSFAQLSAKKENRHD